MLGALLNRSQLHKQGHCSGHYYGHYHYQGYGYGESRASKGRPQTSPTRTVTPIRRTGTDPKLR